MKSEKISIHKSKQEFSGCVELVPPPPAFIEFIDADRLWGLPMRQLLHFVLEENPEHHGKKTVPPDQLHLFYGTAVVVLRGWRLELMLDHLMAGRVRRVHAEKHLGALILGEAWVSEIHVVPSDNASLLAGQTEFPVTIKKS